MASDLNPPVFTLDMCGDMKSNWQNFEQSFSSFATAMGYRIPGQEKPDCELAAMMNALPEVARDILQSDLTWAAYEDKTDPKLNLEKLAAFYGGVKNTIHERVEFNQMYRSQSEPISHWEMRCREQGAKCEYCNSCVSHLIRDRFISGINDDRLQTHLVNSAAGFVDPTLEYVVLQATLYDSVEQSSTQQNPSKQTNQIYTESKTETIGEDASSTKFDPLDILMGSNASDLDADEEAGSGFSSGEEEPSDLIQLKKELEEEIKGSETNLSYSDPLQSQPETADSGETGVSQRTRKRSAAHNNSNTSADTNIVKEERPKKKPNSKQRKHPKPRTKPTQHTCETCDKTFKNSSRLNKHRKIHEREPDKCEVCGEGFETRRMKSAHMKTHADLKLHQCNFCGKAFGNIRVLKQHLIRHREAPCVCDICNKGFYFPSDLSKHMRSHTGERPYKCETCGKSFTQSSGLNTHLIYHTDMPYKCDVCSKGFPTRDTFSRHILIHTGEKPYTCDICGKSFTDSSTLTHHRRIHTGEKPFKCEVCFKCFRTSSNLYSHKLQHTDERPHQCDLCGKCFKESKQLLVHKKRHSGEKNHKCEECGKCFVIACNLRRHMRIHTGEKPYSCDICGKCFSQSNEVKVHKRTHIRSITF